MTRDESRTAGSREGSVPQHVAIIMDGNRRWASTRGLPLVAGYERGIKAFRNAIPAAVKHRIPVTTFWGFSTENWRRSPAELGILFQLFRHAVAESLGWLNRQNARLRISGRLHDFPEDLRRAAEAVIQAPSANTGITVNLALSYGGREEIQHVARRVASETAGNPAAIAAVNEETIARHLYTNGLPDVDLLIRTGGEKRLSGFLPWQAAYAELYFTDALWPDFDERELDRELTDYASRKRNFGT